MCGAAMGKISVISFFFMLSLGTITGTPLAAAPTECVSPFVNLGDRCYYAIKDQKSKAFGSGCRDLHWKADKVSIDSAEEMSLLVDYLQKAGFADGHKFWTNGDKLNDDEVFRWEGSLNQARDITYANWLGGVAPTLEADKNCVQIILKHKELLMYPEHCSYQESYICEMAAEMKSKETEKIIDFELLA